MLHEWGCLLLRGFLKHLFWVVINAAFWFPILLSSFIIAEHSVALIFVKSVPRFNGCLSGVRKWVRWKFIICRKVCCGTSSCFFFQSTYHIHILLVHFSAFWESYISCCGMIKSFKIEWWVNSKDCRVEKSELWSIFHVVLTFLVAQFVIKRFLQFLQNLEQGIHSLAKDVLVDRLSCNSFLLSPPGQEKCDPFLG